MCRMDVSPQQVAPLEGDATMLAEQFRPAAAQTLRHTGARRSPLGGHLVFAVVVVVAFICS